MYRLIPIVLSFFIIGAHFLRSGALGLTIMCLTAPLALLIKRKWIVRVFSILLCFIAIDWISTAFDIWMKRQVKGEPATRMLIILSVVALFSACSSLVFRTKKMKERYSANANAATAGTVTFFLTFITLLYVLIAFFDKNPLLLDHFLPAGGALEAFWLAIYAGFIADFMQNPLVSQYLRRKIWLFFSLAFFLQLILGLFGFSDFLMTGTLRLPVPMLIAAGPVFRNAGFYMLILFAATTILVGPAWCSFLCYFGALDNLAACKKKTPGSMPKWRTTMQLGILLAVLIVALALRYLGISPIYAAYLAGAFGIGGIAVIWFWSRKTGVMTHCTAYCPIGSLATLLGKLSPFRIRIDDDCDNCGSCTPLCRYDALSTSDIERKKPGLSCTLCGDCVSACEKESIDFSFPMLSPKRARTIFIVIVISLHAIFLGLVRI